MQEMIIGASLVVQVVKHLPAMQETQVQSLGQEDPLEKGMATHSSILAWMDMLKYNFCYYKNNSYSCKCT